MKTVIYSLARNFVDFALSAVTVHAKKLGGWLGARTRFWKSAKTRSGLKKFQANVRLLVNVLS